MLIDIKLKKENSIFKIDFLLDQETGEILTLDNLINLSGVVFCSNLDTAFIYIVKNLIKNGFKNVFQAEKENQFSFVYKNGECLSIFIKKKHPLRLMNFEKKFSQPFRDYNSNLKLLNYAKANGRVAVSLGRDAFVEWLKSAFLCKGRQLSIDACLKLFREDYPIISHPLLDRAKEVVSGFQFSRPGYYENTFVYDIASSFPSQLLNATPKGNFKEFENIESVPKSYFYIVKFVALDIKTKKNKIDFLNIDGKNVETLVLTKHLFELFKSNYYVSRLSVRLILGFKTSKGKFTRFVEKSAIGGKELEFDPLIKKYNKAIANSLTGYFGKNTLRLRTKWLKGSIVESIIKSKPIYLPVYLFVLGKAKAEFIKTLQQVGFDNIIYANTDGFISKNKLDLKFLNLGRTGKIGNFKEKKCFKKLFIECVNGYAGETTTGEIDNTLSGMKLVSKVSVEEYKNKNFNYIVKEVTPGGEIAERIIKRGE